MTHLLERQAGAEINAEMIDAVREFLGDGLTADCPESSIRELLRLVFQYAERRQGRGQFHCVDRQDAGPVH